MSWNPCPNQIELARDLRKVARELGRPPTTTEYDKQGRYSKYWAYKWYPDWASALRSAGLTPSLRQGSRDHRRPTTAQAILLAVAQLTRDGNPTVTRQVARHSGLPLGTVNDYLYYANPYIRNGDLLAWQPGQARTLRLGPNAAVVYEGGQPAWVGRAEKIEPIP